MIAVFTARILFTCPFQPFSSPHPLCTGLHLLPQSTYQWASKGAEHVDSALKEDKRQITGSIWANAAGAVVFTELIFAGKTSRSLPSPLLRAKFQNIMYQFTPNHWASLATKQAATLRLWDYAVAAKAKELGVTLVEAADRTHIILMLDCWPVNLTSAYRTFVKDKCPGIQLMFVPAGATGKFQVSNVVHSVLDKSVSLSTSSPLSPLCQSVCTSIADWRHGLAQALQGPLPRARQCVAGAQGAALHGGGRWA